MVKAPRAIWGVRWKKDEESTPGPELGGGDYQLSAQMRIVVVIGKQTWKKSQAQTWVEVEDTQPGHWVRCMGEGEKLGLPGAASPSCSESRLEAAPFVSSATGMVTSKKKWGLAE
jgi:hypothetical protein